LSVHRKFVLPLLAILSLVTLGTARATGGTFAAAVNYDTGTMSFPRSVAVADFNGDGKPDLAVADESGNVSILLGNGDGTFQPAANYPAGTDPFSVAVGLQRRRQARPRRREQPL